MKSITLKKFFGFYNQIPSFMKIGAYCHNPIKYLKSSSDSHDDLVCILTLIQRAVFLVRSIDLLVSRDGDWNYDLIFTGVLFIFSRQIAQFLLFVNGFIIHFLMRIFFRKNDHLAAKRSHTYSTIALDPTYFLLYFAVSQDSIVYSIIKPFHLLLIAMVIRLLLKVINISVLYKINFHIVAFATLLVSSLVFSIYPTFYIPSLLSIYLSPAVLVDDVDLSLLEYRHVDVDSSIDGSSLLINLEPLPVHETVIIDSLAKNKDSIETLDISFINSRLKAFEPFWHVTYFNKQHIPRQHRGMADDTLYRIMNSDLFMRLKPHLFLIDLKILSLTRSTVDHSAVEQIKKSISLFSALAKSNLGIVGSVSGATFYNNILTAIEPHICELRNTNTLAKLASTIANNPVDVEWGINALRLEAHHSIDIDKKSCEDAERTMNPIIDSLGYYVPGFIMKKWVDAEETCEITQYIWARKINKIYQRQKIVKEDQKEINKILTWAGDSWFGVKKLVLFPNTVGRILSCTAIPNYEGYVRGIEDYRRHQEFILMAIAQRYNLLVTDKKNETLEQINSTLQILSPFELESKYSFSYDSENKVLTSKDTIPARIVYSIKF